MNNRNKELLTAIQTNGPIPVRGDPVRVRYTRTGSRTQAEATGQVLSHASSDLLPWRVVDEEAQTGATTITLADVLAGLRDTMRGMPLTAVLHGWGSSSTQQFFAALQPLLARRDALWLIPDGESAEPLPATGSAVILNLAKDVDQRLYRNMCTDVVFYPASADGDPAQIASWLRRTACLMFDARGSLREQVLRASVEAQLITYAWEGGVPLKMK